MTNDIAEARRLVEAGQCQAALQLLNWPLAESAPAEVMKVAATALEKLGRTSDAAEVLRRVVNWERDANNRVEEGAVLLRLARLLVSSGKFEDARTALNEGLALSTSTNNLGHEAQVLDRLGELAVRQRDDVKAREYLERAQGIRRTIGETTSAAFFAAEDHLTVIALKQKRYEVARAGYRQRLSRLAGADDPKGTARAMHSLGIVEFATGNFRDAGPVLQASLEIWKELGLWDQQARVLASLAAVKIAENNLALGWELIGQGLEVAARVDAESMGRRDLLDQLCALAVRRKKIDVAATLLLLLERERKDQEAARDLSRFGEHWHVAEATMAKIRDEVAREYACDRGRRLIREVLAALAPQSSR